MSSKPKTLRWLILTLVAFFIFVVLQVPAAWLISKFYKNNQTLHNVNGNIWQGSADWKKGNLRGSLNWKV
ncbi:MAG TPA: general secretion pathway protein, partial [Acinetobacter lwoffii]|nr:general secretion pathway protein [Acinetobacter lwoffii]